MGFMIALYFGLLLGGALLGLIPFVLGRVMGRPNLGLLGLICCAASAVIHISLPVLAAVGFSAAVFLIKTDIRMGGASRPAAAPPPGPAAPDTPAVLTLTCLSGPLRGQSYRLGPDGLIFGRDNVCAVHFPIDTAGVSRRHCAVRWHQGCPVLVDLDSSCGTFMGDGRQLPPNYPTRVGPGSRFYLGGPENLFQVTMV